MTQPTEFLTGIFVGDQFTAANAQFFRDNNIVRVVNCTKTLPFYYNQSAQYFRVPVDDSSDDQNNEIMARHMLPAIRFVLEIQPSASRGVLIHCHAGVSRSCTVAAAVIRYCCAQTIPIAINMLISKRDFAFFRGMYVNFSKALYQVFKF